MSKIPLYISDIKQGKKNQEKKTLCSRELSASSLPNEDVRIPFLGGVVSDLWTKVDLDQRNSLANGRMQFIIYDETLKTRSVARS